MALADKARAYWKMHELNNATRVDSTANAHDLAATGNINDRNVFCTSIATEFPTGSNENLQTPATGGISPSGAFENTGWFQWDVGSTSNGFVIGAQSSGVFDPQDYAIFLTAPTGTTFDAEFRIRKADNSGYTTVTVAGLSKGVNYFYNSYYTGSQLGLAFSPQGNLSRTAFTTASHTGGIRQSAEAVFMGSDPFIGSFRIIGYMEEVGFWDPLTDEERDYLYGLSTGGCPPEYPFTQPVPLTFNAAIEFFFAIDQPVTVLSSPHSLKRPYVAREVTHNFNIEGTLPQAKLKRAKFFACFGTTGKKKGTVLGKIYFWSDRKRVGPLPIIAGQTIRRQSALFECGVPQEVVGREIFAELLWFTNDVVLTNKVCDLVELN